MFEELDEFRKDLKHLLKKYRMLESELNIVRQDLTDEPGEQPPFSYSIDN